MCALHGRVVDIGCVNADNFFWIALIVGIRHIFFILFFLWMISADRFVKVS